MSEPQETRTERKQERIEKPQASSSKPRKVYVLGVAFVAVLLLGASFGIMISATTPNIPTVIEPGSMIGSANYVIFEDGVNYYGRNGMTGAIAYSGTNALTVFNSVIGQLPHGGTIFTYEGSYTFSTPLTISTAHITITGQSKSMPFGTVPTGPKEEQMISPNGTRFIGDVKIEAGSCVLNSLAIIGKLTYTSAADFSSVASFCDANSIYVLGGVDIIGLAGATESQVPYCMAFTNSFFIGLTPKNALNMTSPDVFMEHIYFTNTELFQFGVGSVVWCDSLVSDVTFLNCIFDTSSAYAVLNLSSSVVTKLAWKLIGCEIELNAGANQVFLMVGAGATSHVQVFISDSHFSGTNPKYLVKDTLGTNFGANCMIVFTRVYFQDPHVHIFGAGLGNVMFVDCYFQSGTIVEQLSASSSSSALFINCWNLNPYGLIATPFSGVNDDWKTISIASGYAGSATPPASKNIMVYDTAVQVSASGGTGLSIYVYDRAGNAVLSGATSLTAYYIPPGFKINFGAFSGGPTFIVVGV